MRFCSRRFNGDGNSGTAEYKVWKRWTRAAPVVKKVGGMRPEALGPWMYTLLDGQAAPELESIEIKDLCKERVNLPSEARGCVVLRGYRLGRLGRATVMSAARGSWEFDKVCTAIRGG